MITIGNEVRIVANNNRLDPNIYKLDKYQSDFAFVTCLLTGIQSRVHKSRLVQADDKPDEELMTTVKQQKSTIIRSSGVKKSIRSKFDFTSLLNEMGPNAEHWRKSNEFNHGGIISEAHVIISGDRTSFISMNTYNGSLGKSNKIGNKYDLRDYDKKIKNISDSGYVKVEY